jgi:hypothetical protein
MCCTPAKLPPPLLLPGCRARPDEPPLLVRFSTDLKLPLSLCSIGCCCCCCCGPSTGLHFAPATPPPPLRPAAPAVRLPALLLLRLTCCCRDCSRSCSRRTSSASSCACKAATDSSTNSSSIQYGTARTVSGSSTAQPWMNLLQSSIGIVASDSISCCSQSGVLWLACSL